MQKHDDRKLRVGLIKLVTETVEAAVIGQSALGDHAMFVQQIAEAIASAIVLHEVLPHVGNASRTALGRSVR